MDGIGGHDDRTFCKLTSAEPSRHPTYRFHGSFSIDDSPAGTISNDAKVLYALLLDRASISRQNGYVEPDGTIRLYFTLEQAQTKLHRSRQMRHADLPGAGVQRLDLSERSRAWASPH